MTATANRPCRGFSGGISVSETKSSSETAAGAERSFIFKLCASLGPAARPAYAARRMSTPN